MEHYPRGGLEGQAQVDRECASGACHQDPSSLCIHEGLDQLASDHNAPPLDDKSHGPSQFQRDCIMKARLKI